jgi:hypothetical protein
LNVENVQAAMIAAAMEPEDATSAMSDNPSQGTSSAGAESTSIRSAIVSDQPSSVEVLQVNPNRPTHSNSAEVLPQGVMQAEYGYTQDWELPGGRQTTLGGEVRLGIWRNFEFRWGNNPLVDNLTSNTNAFGIGDEYLSGQFQFRKQSEKSPALAVSYAVSLPTGNESLGLGAGRVNHSLTFLASKNIDGFTVNFNAQYQLIGREAQIGHDQNALFYLGFQKTLHGPLSFLSEFGEGTWLNPQTPTNSTLLEALAYKVNRRIVVDGAIDEGITKDGPQKRVTFGISYLVGKLY